MAVKGRFKDAEWDLSDENGRCADWERAQLACLLDLRDELKGLRSEMSRLNALLHCSNFVNIPRQLRHLEVAAKRANKNAAKRRKAKV